MKRRHPIQNTEFDSHGTLRFARNEIVRFLLDNSKYDLNHIYMQFHRTHPEDYEQLMMLIGYSIGGFADLCQSVLGEEKPCKRATLAAADRKHPLNLHPRE